MPSNWKNNTGIVNKTGYCNKKESGGVVIWMLTWTNSTHNEEV